MDKLYHVTSYDNYCLYYADSNIVDTSNINRNIENFQGKKRTLEEVLEKVRKEKYIHCPSRLTSLFVFSEKDKEDNEIDWAKVFGNPQYVLLTLEIEEGCVKWLDSSKYIMNNIDESIANEYWDTSSDEYNKIKSPSIEGLFQGIARIIKKESKIYTKEFGIKLMEIL